MIVNREIVSVISAMSQRPGRKFHRPVVPTRDAAEISRKVSLPSEFTN